jgi:hypothetical protein
MTDIDTSILLSNMRAASSRLRRDIAERRCELHDIEEVAITLKAGRISAVGAVAWLRANGVAELVLTPGREDAAA